MTSGIDNPLPPERNGRFTNSVDLLLLLIVVIAAALAMSPNVADPDLWGHVQFGRDVLASHSIADTTSYSFTAEGYRWINHENLSEIVMALVVDYCGPLGLVIGKFLLSLFVILAILIFNLKQGTGTVVASILTLLVAANLGYHWSIRPQLSSFVAFTLLILLFQYGFAGWRDHWHLKFSSVKKSEARRLPPEELGICGFRLKVLWLLVPLFFIWANSHGGFVAGVAVAVAYLGLRAVEAIIEGGGWQRTNPGWTVAGRLLFMAALIGMVTLANPYGAGLQIWLLESLGSPRPEISDWSTSPLFSSVGIKLWFLVAVTGLALWGSRREHDATQSLILAILFWQSVAHFRHAPFFAIAAGFWIGPHLKSTLDYWAKPTATTVHTSVWSRALLQAGLILLMIISGTMLGNRLSDLQVRRDQFPVDAIDFMRQQGLHGKLVVSYDWAQYSIAALCSDTYLDDSSQKSQVAFDGRFRTCYPQPIIDMHFDFLYGNTPSMQRHRDSQSLSVDSGRVLRFGSPDLVLLKRQGERTENHMYENTPQWTLLYQDAIAQVWGRSTIYDNLEHPDHMPVGLRVVHDKGSSDSVTWPAIRPVQNHAVQPKTTQLLTFLTYPE